MPPLGERRGIPLGHSIVSANLERTDELGNVGSARRSPLKDAFFRDPESYLADGMVTDCFVT